MCLLALVWQQLPDYPLLLAANRDEVHRRPTQAADFWTQHPHRIGGRDQEAGGSWLLATRQGRWAALTNVREGGEKPPPKARTRGDLVIKATELPFQQLLEELPQEQGFYAGYNLLWGDHHQAWYFSNRTGKTPQLLEPGTYLLSNAALDTPWPKTEKLRHSVKAWMAQQKPQPQQLFAKLADENPASDKHLPDTGIGLDWERFLSPIFIRGEDYGTRASTLLWLESNKRMTLWERSFNAHAELLLEQKLQWLL